MAPSDVLAAHSSYQGFLKFTLSEVSYDLAVRMLAIGTPTLWPRRAACELAVWLQSCWQRVRRMIDVPDLLLALLLDYRSMFLKLFP